MKTKIGYNKLIVSLPVLLAGLLALLAYLASRKGLEVGNETYFLIVGLLVLSVPMYFLPYIVITDTEIYVNNQFGMPRRRAKISGLQDIRFEKGTLMIRGDDFERKLYYNLLLVDARALRAFKQKVEALNAAR